MPYYQGDYYQGDYYRGDPFVHKKLLKGLGKIGTALIPSPIRAAVEIGKAFIGPPRLPTALGPLPLPQFPTDGGPLQSQGVLDVIAACAPGGKLMRGYRWNKSTYVTRGGGTSRWPQGLQVHPKGSTCVPYRRMNVANPRALRRALRRAQGFAKLARRMVRIQNTYRKGGSRRRKK